MKIEVRKILHESDQSDILRTKVEEYLNNNSHQIIEVIAAEYAKQFLDDNKVYVAACGLEAIAAGLLSLEFSFNVEAQPGIILATKKYSVDNLEPMSFKVNENKLYIYFTPTKWLEAEYCASDSKLERVKKELEGEFNALYSALYSALLKHIMTSAKEKINNLEERLRAAEERASEAGLQLSLLRQRIRYAVNELYGILEDFNIPEIVREKISDLAELLGDP